MGGVEPPGGEGAKREFLISHPRLKSKREIPMEQEIEKNQILDHPPKKKKKKKSREGGVIKIQNVKKFSERKLLFFLAVSPPPHPHPLFISLSAN